MLTNPGYWSWRAETFTDDREPGPPRPLLPLGHLAARGVEHVRTDRHDETGLLGDRDEIVGPHRFPVPVPSDQRLDGPHGSGAQVDDRLVVDDQVLTVSALAKGRLGALAFDRLAPQGVIEDDPTTAAVGLRLVHRGVGVAEHRSGIGLGRIGVGDADRDAGVDLVTVDQERGLEGRSRRGGR